MNGGYMCLHAKQKHLNKWIMTRVSLDFSLHISLLPGEIPLTMYFL